MKPRTVISMEQALSLSYGTLRLAQLGWRVIRLESAPRAGQKTPGDPNRYVGRPAAGPDRRSYFIAPNVGKEAIAIDLKSQEGRSLLFRIVRDLPVDVFASNTLPRRYAELGIDYETLSRANEDLIWIGVSALGPDHPDAPGYDPMLQALLGYMDLTGQADGPPTLMGVPMVDLKAGDEVFAQTMLALAERAEGKKGARIDISMARAAVSWLQTTLPLLDLGASAEDVRRSGNEHREFVPVNVYATADSWLYLAIGNDVQWRRLTDLAPFRTLARESRDTNEGRKSDRVAIHSELAEVIKGLRSESLVSLLGEARIPASPVNPVGALHEMTGIREHLTRTVLPDGREVRLPPAPVETTRVELPVAPRYGEHTCAVLGAAGLDEVEIDDLQQRGIIH